MMILINGGSSSGKSAFAETLIVEQAKKEEVMAEPPENRCSAAARKTDLRHQPSCYLATMIAWGRGVQGQRIRKTPQNAGKKEFYDHRVPCGTF